MYKHTYTFNIDMYLLWIRFCGNTLTRLRTSSSPSYAAFYIFHSIFSKGPLPHFLHPPPPLPACANPLL